MKFRLSSALLFVFFSFCILNAQQQQKGFNIKLRLIDESSGKGVEFATVSIVKDGEKQASAYSLTDGEGHVVLRGVKKDKYILRAELLGYDKLSKEITVDENINLGEIKMKVQINLLEGAVVTSAGNPIIVKKDTVEYNASSFKTTESDMLEDLLKKLPGIEVGADGAITSNGKTITKITIDGKTFFLNDPQLASKNIPAKIIEKVKVLEKKSEQAEFTGIDDGNQETIIDLSVMKGMMNGWFGNIMGGAGTDLREEDRKFRFQGSAMIGKFAENEQLAFIGNANNTNNRSFNDLAGVMMSGMRGGGMGRGGYGFNFRGNGISTSFMTGLNANKDFSKNLETSANYLFNGNQKQVRENTSKTLFRNDGTSTISSNEGYSNTNTYGHRAGARADWKLSKNTSILFTPQFNIGYGDFKEYSDFSTQSDNSGNISNINSGYKLSSGDNNSQSTNGNILLRQRLGKPGRTISLNIDYSYSNNTIDGYNKSVTNIYEKNSVIDSLVVDQIYDRETRSYGMSGRLSYTEPIGNNFFAEATYLYDYGNSKSERNTYGKDDDGKYTVKDEKYSNKIDNETVNQRAGLSIMKQEDRYSITVGATLQPSKTKNTTVVNGKERNINRNVLNWAPNARFDYNFSDYRMIRLRYRGRTSQPSVNQLQPVEDNSDPLNIVRGNPNLHPSFSHSLNTMYFSNNRSSFSSFNADIDVTYNMNNIVNASWTSSEGVTYRVPMNNEKGTFSTQAGLMFNSPIAKSKFSFMSSTNGQYSNSMSFVGKASLDGNNAESYLNKDNFYENRYNMLSVSEYMRFTYRDNILELTLGGNVRYSKSWYQITKTNVNATWTNSLTSSVNVTIPGVMGIVTDGRYTFYKGYDKGYNDPVFVWNAELNKQILYGMATISVKAYDILNMSRNTYRTIADNYIQDVKNNTLGRYIMLNFTVRFGTFSGSSNYRRMHGGSMVFSRGGRR